MIFLYYHYIYNEILTDYAFLEKLLFVTIFHKRGYNL